MNLIALLIGLVVERLATQLFHLRRLRWLEKVIDAGFRLAERVPNWPSLVPIVLLVIVLVLPVAAVILWLGDAFFEFPYLVVAVVVLFFSIGPQDIGEDVNEYCKAVEDGDAERIRQTAKAIIESEVPADELERIHRVEEAVCVQANNRLFAVVFWFVLFDVLWFAMLGPLGAWTYRMTDLIRRRAVFCADREETCRATTPRLRDAAVTLHGWLAWIPARLTAIGYAAAGHFDAALAAWRAPGEQREDSTSEYNEHLLARVGVAALALRDDEDEDLTQRAVRGATAAIGLVFRLLLIWAVVIAAMTLYGWTR
ncbi:MAG TPA: regulatory signaling modulator protein AmpE [Woeseiaceae bacterium]|jgi:AmpE protein|nr:regulatory signaling modulator protein AmpE [Woeseiaceae bacterium]